MDASTLSNTQLHALATELDKLINIELREDLGTESELTEYMAQVADDVIGEVLRRMRP